MSEKRFLTYILLEGIILTVLGLCILILPKLTELSFGVMLSSAFVTYGLYKMINSLVNRHSLRCFVTTLLMGMFVLTLGVLLLFVPKISLLWLIAFTGVYFLLESICAVGFMAQISSRYNFWGCKFFSAVVLFAIGLLIVVGIPAVTFWAVAMFSGVGFLIKGMSKMALYNVNKDIIDRTI